MRPPSRRNLLTAAAAAIAATPTLAAAQARAPGGAGLPSFASRRAAAGQRIERDAEAIWCAGYARAGDRGQALYARVAADPRHGGTFQSADGAWWELAEGRLNPFMFGAKAQPRADDSGAIQAMFDFVEAKRGAYPICFEGARYYIARGVRLPSVPSMVTLDIDGAGAVIASDQPITFFSRVPASQAEAERVMSLSHYDIHHFEFQGRHVDGQVGLHIGAAYGNLVRNCFFSRLDYGTIGTFCLAGAWRDLLYYACRKRGAVIQTGTGFDGGPVWPGAVETNSASNVNVFENCRVYGHPDQISAFGIFGSDAVRMNGCISEGHGAGIDVHFDYQRSPTVKQFHIDMFHCESPPAKVNFRIRAGGKVTLERIVRSYPAALLDMQGSEGAEVIMRSFAWLGELPEPGKPNNPRGRWFFHSRGNGLGAAKEGWSSSGTTYRFEDCVEQAWKLLSDPERWEGGKLPEMLYIRGTRPANNGMIEWSTADISYGSPISFEGEGRFFGIRSGTVTAKTARVPAGASVDEAFEVPGLSPVFHSVTLHPQAGVHAPPPGILWNAWIEHDGVVTLRLTNVTGREIALKPGAIWTYSAPRRG